MNTILENFIKTGSNNLPDNINPRISLKTLQEQIEILQKLKFGSNSSENGFPILTSNEADNTRGNLSNNQRYVFNKYYRLNKNINIAAPLIEYDYTLTSFYRAGFAMPPRNVSLL